ncbi:MAG: hypothetical protein KC503_09330 [Myxococcales bacterium]|nr:hypothetical protein [Myxococcales bacterium]
MRIHRLIPCALLLLAASCQRTEPGAVQPGAPTRGKADTAATIIGSCARYTSFRDDFCGAPGCRPTLAAMVQYIGSLMCAGSDQPATLRGNCSVAVLDLESGTQAAYHGDEQAYAASTIKLVMVAAALYYGVAPSSIEADALAIFAHSSNSAPARVLDALQRVLPAGARAADRVNAFLHDVAGASARSQLTRWCPAGEICHVASSCGALGRCGDVMPVLTANDALRVLHVIEAGGFAGRAALSRWASVRDQDLGLYGVRSCGLSQLTIEHKVGSLWFDEEGLTYNDAAIIRLPGRAPLLLAFFDGYQAHQGQQGRAAYALVRLLRDGVVDFSGSALSPSPSPPPPSPPSPSPGHDAGAADARGDVDVSALGDPRAACETVHQINTCSRRRADTLLVCQPNIERYYWQRCPAACVYGGHMAPDFCN